MRMLLETNKSLYWRPFNLSKCDDTKMDIKQKKKWVLVVIVVFGMVISIVIVFVVIFSFFFFIIFLLEGQQTNTQTVMATRRLNQPRGWLSKKVQAQKCNG